MADTFRRCAGLSVSLAFICALSLATPPIAAAQSGNGAESGATAKQKQDGDAAGKGGTGEQKGRKRGRGKRGPPMVQVDPVKVVPVTQTVPVLGRLVARQTSTIAARTAGPIETLHVQVGERVKKGDVLATIVSDTLRWRHELRASEVEAFQASIESSKAQLAKAQNEMRRMRELQKSAAFSKARYEDQLRVVENAHGELNKSLAELRQAQANLRLAEIEMYNAKVRAPYDGVVTQRHTFDGAYVSVGGPVVTLLNDAELEIEADVPANRLAGLKAGGAVEAEIDGKPIEARVRAVVPDENPLARTRAVRFTPAGSLIHFDAAANQTVLLRIPIGKARVALSVHKDAVLQRGGGAVVYVIDAQDLAQMRSVKLGEAVASRFEVLDGLAAGERAVVRGNERLREGQRVRVKAETGRTGAEAMRRKTVVIE